MSYEEWQKIWQQQVTPRLSTNVDPQVLLARVKDDSNQFEHDWRRMELRELAIVLGLVLLFFVLHLLGVKTNIHYDWFWWMLIPLLAAYHSAGVLTHWFFGRDSASDTGDSLRDVIARATIRRRLHLKLIHFRHGAGLIMLSSYAIVSLVKFIGHERNLDDWCSFYVFATVFLLAVWAGFQKQRARCKELQARIKELEKLRTELDVADGTALPPNP